MKTLKTIQTKQHVFAEIPAPNILRSVFDRSHNHKTTISSNWLYPVYSDEMLPGDTFQCDMSVVTRMTTAIVPAMDNIYEEVYAFVVPMRLLQDHFEEMMGAWKDPTDTTQYINPVVKAPSGGFGFGSLYDYLGLPCDVAGIEVDAKYPRAYYKIYNDWFRKGAIEAELSFSTGDGVDTTNYVLQKRYKRADYFTSALPYMQKGPAASIGLAGYAPVEANPSTTTSDITPFRLYDVNAGKYGYLSPVNTLSSAIAIGVPTGSATVRGITVNPTHVQNPSDYSQEVGEGVTQLLSSGYNAYLSLRANLNNSSAVTISSLRTAFALQRWEEALARATGGRYVEIIKAFFNVDCPDYRLQRAEFIGKLKFDINLQTVIQTSSTDSVTPQGNLAAVGYGSAFKPLFRYSANEHCVLMVLANIRTDNTYQYGINRMFSRKTKYDYFWSQFQFLSEQEVLNKEIYAQGTSADDQVWAYQERYAEYRYFPNQVTGQFRSNHPQSLDIWHYAQKFTSLPVYGQTFLKENTAISRNLAVQNYPEFWSDMTFIVTAIRPMAVYSVPGLVDHF